MFHRNDFGGFLVCCYKAIQQLNGVEKNSVAVSLMLNHNLSRLKRVRAFKIELEFGSVDFWEKGKTGVPREKPLGARERTNNKLNPHKDSTQEFEPRPHWWRRVLLTLRHLACSCWVGWSWFFKKQPTSYNEDTDIRKLVKENNRQETRGHLKRPCSLHIREFKQIATAVVDAVSWGEYVS